MTRFNEICHLPQGKGNKIFMNHYKFQNLYMKVIDKMFCKLSKIKIKTLNELHQIYKM